MERAFNLGNKEFGSESLKAVPHYATPLYWVSAADSGDHDGNQAACRQHDHREQRDEDAVEDAAEPEPSELWVLG